jgi:hypothetical protein
VGEVPDSEGHKADALLHGPYSGAPAEPVPDEEPEPVAAAPGP